MENSESKINQILEKTQSCFLQGSELTYLFKNLDKLDFQNNFKIQIVSQLPFQPEPGSIYLIKNADLSEQIQINSQFSWKKDGYEYSKRKTGGIQEYRQIIKVKEESADPIYVLYAQTNKTVPFSLQVQRRIYWQKSNPKYRLIHYSILKNKNSLQSVTYSKEQVCFDRLFHENQSLNWKQYYSECSIKYLSPANHSCKSGGTIFLILSAKIQRNLMENAQVILLQNKVEAKFVNPFTVKTKVPACLNPQVLKPEILLSNNQLVRNNKCFFEYTSDFMEEFDKDVRSIFDEESSNDFDFEPNSETEKLERSSERESIRSGSPRVDLGPIDCFCDEIQREKQILFFDDDSNQKYEENVKKIQKNVRGWIARKKYQKLKKVIIKLQQKFKFKKKKS